MSDATLPALLTGVGAAAASVVRITTGARETHLMVPYADRTTFRSARSVLSQGDWRYEVGRPALGEGARRVTYASDSGEIVHLSRGVDAGPVPARAMHALEVALLQEASLGSHGIAEADAAARLVHAAVQLVRPRASTAFWRNEVAQATTIADWSRVTELTRRTGAGRAVATALASTPLPAGTATPAVGTGLGDLVWGAARLLERRLSGPLAPVANAIGGRAVHRSRFAGVDVLSGPGVFVPVAVTEHLVGIALDSITGSTRPIVVEVGTGCGAVALAIACRRPDVEVHASDVSRPALRWARRNRRRLRADGVRFYRGSLLAPFPAELRAGVAAVVSSVPYVPPALWRRAWERTPNAVGGHGADGLALVRQLAVEARALLRPRGVLVLQLGADQWETLAGELRAAGYRPMGVVRGRAADVVGWAEAP